MRKRIKQLLMGIIINMILIGLWGPTLFAMDEKEILQERYRIKEMAQEALSTLYEMQPGARYAIEHAAGYGVFSTFGIKIFFAGGTTGKGFVYNNRTQRYTYMKMLQVQGGLGLGISKNRVIWVFETQKALNDFINLGFRSQGPRCRHGAEPGVALFSGAISVAPGVYLYQTHR